MLDRRSMLSALAAAPLAAAPLKAAPLPTSPLSTKGNSGSAIGHESQLRKYLRITADASGKVAFNYWRGAYLVTLPGQPPSIMFNLEGCEMRKCITIGPNRYRSEYRLMTSIVDPATNEILNGKDWTNPLTGKTVRIVPRTSSADTELWQDDEGRIHEQYKGDTVPSTLVFTFSEIGSKIYLSGFKHRDAPQKSASIDYGTIIADRDDVLKGVAPSVPSVFHSSFVAPLFGFLNMPDDAGRAFWHVSGLKLATWNEIPERHRKEISTWLPKAVEWALG